MRSFIFQRGAVHIIAANVLQRLNDLCDSQPPRVLLDCCHMLLSLSVKVDQIALCTITWPLAEAINSDDISIIDITTCFATCAWESRAHKAHKNADKVKSVSFILTLYFKRLIIRTAYFVYSRIANLRTV